MTFATPADVAVALGRPLASDAETAQVEWWLASVELVIKSRLGDLLLLDPDVLRYVEVEAVAEKARRRGNAESSITVSVDDGSVTRRYDSSLSREDITDEWWAMLTPSITESAAFTIRFQPPRAVPWSENWQ